MDLRSVGVAKAADKAIPVKILHPRTQAPLGLEIDIIGSDSAEYRAASRRQQNADLARMAPGKKMKVTREELDAKALELRIIATKAWRQLDDKGKWKDTITLDKEELACTPENVRRLYEDPDMVFIVEQIDEAIGDRSAFLQN